MGASKSFSSKSVISIFSDHTDVEPSAFKISENGSRAKLLCSSFRAEKINSLKTIICNACKLSFLFWQVYNVHCTVYTVQYTHEVKFEKQLHVMNRKVCLNKNTGKTGLLVNCQTVIHFLGCCAERQQRQILKPDEKKGRCMWIFIPHDCKHFKQYKQMIPVL